MKYALINGVILNGHQDMEPIYDQIILIDNKKIKDIVFKNEDISGYKIIDLKGKYIIPGLINLHVHLPASGKPKKKASDPKKLVKLITRNKLTNQIGIKLCISYAKTELLSGVTTIRTVGGVENYDTVIRDMIENGEIIGPRIIASNKAISVPGGHMAGSLAYEARNVQEAKHYVDIIAQDHPDIIKLMITGGVMDAEVIGEPGVLKMPPEYVKVACDRAHELGFQVAAHVESTQGVLVALENGVDSIEHGAKPTEKIIDLMKKNHAYQVSTISPALPYALFNRDVSHATYEQQENGRIVFQGIIDMANACLQNDIPVGLGTDTGCPYITHYDMWRELVYFSKYCHVTPRFALYSATLLNAKLAGIADKTGSIEKGKMADIVVVDKNPLIDLTTLRNITMVMKEGYIIEHPRIKKMNNVEKELDKFI
ncbi:MAG: amidohydrolase family protein [Faecalibacillus sp.]